jgi:homopolymeric O-antigen transport system permease protein
MLVLLRTLFRYRLLIQSLVGRELKARYRGSLLGFLWSFVNPLLLLLTYWLVFSYIFPGARTRTVEPYFLFIFCGILPWTWLSAAVLESAGVLISGGNLIKKVLFPAEILPAVTVLANLVHFVLGLPILVAFLAVSGHLGPHALLFPVPLLVQLVFCLGLALFVSALTVHFRDLQNILSHLMHLWFFGSPVLYSIDDQSGRLKAALRFNPMTHILVGYQDTLFHDSFPRGRGLLGAAVAALAMLALGAFIFERLRDTLAEEV